jgi:hypothetical protein
MEGYVFVCGVSKFFFIPVEETMEVFGLKFFIGTPRKRHANVYSKYSWLFFIHKIVVDIKPQNLQYWRE